MNQIVQEIVALIKKSNDFFWSLFGGCSQRFSYLSERLKLPRQQARQSTKELLGRILHPRFIRAICGLDDEHLSTQLDVEPIRRVVADLMLKFNKLARLDSAIGMLQPTS
jgi:hypothetical protein